MDANKLAFSKRMIIVLYGRMKTSKLAVSEKNDCMRELLSRSRMS